MPFTFGLPLELNIAFLRDGGLLNGDHLPFHLTKLGCSLLVPSNKESGRPENDYSSSRGNRIVGALFILRP